MARIFFTVLFVVLVGCGSGDQQTVVTISPRPSTVGTSVAFTAAIQHNRVPFLGVNWTLEITSAWSSAGSLTVTGALVSCLHRSANSPTQSFGNRLGNSSSG